MQASKRSNREKLSVLLNNLDAVGLHILAPPKCITPGEQVIAGWNKMWANKVLRYRIKDLRFGQI